MILPLLISSPPPSTPAVVLFQTHTLFPSFVVLISSVRLYSFVFSCGWCLSLSLTVELHKESHQDVMASYTRTQCKSRCYMIIYWMNEATAQTHFAKARTIENPMCSSEALHDAEKDKYTSPKVKSGTEIHLPSKGFVPGQGTLIYYFRRLRLFCF